jgi:RNase P/RNase MRP subunit POP5
MKVKKSSFFLNFQENKKNDVLGACGTGTVSLMLTATSNTPGDMVPAWPAKVSACACFTSESASSLRAAAAAGGKRIRQHCCGVSSGTVERARRGDGGSAGVVCG